MNRGFSAPSPQSSPTHPPICLRTEADGRIPLPNDWVAVFNASAECFETVYLQTRHTYARLVSLQAPPFMTWHEQSGTVRSAEQKLILRPNESSSLFARVQECDCCGSPRRIEFLNSSGHEFLQICAPRPLPAYEWALYVASLTAIEKREKSYPPQGRFPLVPDSSERVAEHPDTVSAFLERLVEVDGSCEVILVTKESIHCQEIAPDHIAYEGEVIGAYSNCASFQFGLAAVRSLRIQRDSQNKSSLLVEGPDGCQLLALRAPEASDQAEAFEELLQDTFTL